MKYFQYLRDDKLESFVSGLDNLLKRRRGNFTHLLPIYWSKFCVLNTGHYISLDSEYSFIRVFFFLAKLSIS